MKRINVNGVELCVETFGDPADPPVLLVGLTMLSWPDELCAALAGRYVVRYDLRDAGQSTFVDPDAPTYDLRDLVTDASELLVALDLGRTHVVGVGVGGYTRVQVPRINRALRSASDAKAAGAAAPRMRAGGHGLGHCSCVFPRSRSHLQCHTCSPIGIW